MTEELWNCPLNLSEKKIFFLPESFSTGLEVKSHSTVLSPAFILWELGFPATCGEDFPGGSDGKVSAYNAGDPGLISGLGRSTEEGNGNPFQYFCLENPMDGGARWPTVHEVAKSGTWLSDFTFPGMAKRRMNVDSGDQSRALPLSLVVQDLWQCSSVLGNKELTWKKGRSV